MLALEVRLQRANIKKAQEKLKAARQKARKPGRPLRSGSMSDERPRRRTCKSRPQRLRRWLPGQTPNL